MISRYPQKLSTTLRTTILSKTTRVLTCTFANTLDKHATLQAFAGARSNGPRRGALRVWAVLCLATLVELSIYENAQALTSKDSYILYLHTKVQSYDQFKCAVSLYSKESNFNPTAHNQSGAWGIPQLKNVALRHMDGYTQIDWGIRYVTKHRSYHGSFCKAYAHFKAKGWH